MPTDGLGRLLRRLDALDMAQIRHRRSKRICIPCRRVGQFGTTCPECGRPTVRLDCRARPPRRRANTRTWQAFCAKFNLVGPSA